MPVVSRVRAWSKASVVSLLVMLSLLPTGIAPPDEYAMSSVETGGDSGGYSPTPPPPGPSYTVTWANGSFTEVTNPLARFKKYPLYDPDNDLIAVLTPLSKPYEANRPIDNLSDVSNAQISDAMLKLGLTKQMLTSAVNSALRDAESAANDAEEAVRLIDGGDLSLAVRHLRSWLRVTIICGSADPLVYEWVAIIPAPIDCNGTDATDELVAVVDMNSLTHSDFVEFKDDGTPIPRNDVPDAAVLTLRALVNVEPLDPVPTNAFVIGFSFRGNGVGITSRLDQLNRITLDVDGLARADVPDVGTVTYTATSTFNAGTRYHITSGEKVSREFSAAPAIESATLSSFSVDYQLDAPLGDRRIRVEPASLALARDVSVHLDQGHGDVMVAEVANPAIPFVARASRWETAAAGVKHNLSFETTDGKGRWLAEVHGTAWDKDGARVVFQVVGLPANGRLVFDYGTQPDQAASIDFQRMANDGWFRSITIDARTPALPWNQTVKDTGRLFMATAREDPTNAEAVPWVYQAVHYETAQTGLSVAEGDGGIVGVYESDMSGIVLADDGAEITDWLLGSRVGCTDSCSGDLPRGAQARGHPSAQVNYTFASLPLGAYIQCALMHEGTSVCV